MTILGDNGYGLKPYLLTPYLQPSNAAEKRYNDVQTKTRNVVERCIGVLKNRWRCLFKTNALRFTPKKCCETVIACCVLHNLARAAGLEEEEQNLVPEENVDDNIIDNLQTEGARVRANFVLQRFS